VNDRPGRLVVIATPLGNPDDLSPRAAAALATADLILAEDTRSARRLLSTSPTRAAATAAGVTAREPEVMSCFDGNETDRAAEAVRRIGSGQTVALVSEAGTPLLSDPGFRVVAAVAAAGQRVEPIPGPSALLAALVASGLPPDRFTFLGFPPRKRGPRRRLFESVRDSPFTLVFYESPMRAADTLDDLAAVLGAGRPACLARELTKTHEEVVRGTAGELADRYRQARPLGEVTLVVAGNPAGERADAATDDELADEAATLLGAKLSPRDVARELAARTGRPRREIYALVTAVAARRATSTAP
jgi:16S rRNA (cytidine1402-2'-O)-methyltransferase